MKNLSSLTKAEGALGVALFGIAGALVLQFTAVGPTWLPGMPGAVAIASTLFAGAMLRKVKGQIGEAARVCAAVAEGDFEVRVCPVREAGNIGEMMWSINRLIDRTDAYVRESSVSMEYVSKN